MNASFIWGCFFGSLATWTLMFLVVAAYRAGQRKGGQ